MAVDTLGAPRPELNPVDPLLVDVPTAAAILSVSPRTLAALTAKNAVPFVRIGGRVLFSPEALREWIAGGCSSQSSNS